MPAGDGWVRTASDYCTVPCVQKPLTQLFVESQQFLAVVHLSPTVEHVGAMFEQMSAPPSPLGSQ
jgi:hypothetical protein